MTALGLRFQIERFMMAPDFALNWAIMAVSLFNTVLLLWLGLTVLLNAERRTWGMWLAGGGLLMGAAFFVSHSAILSYGLHYVGRGTEFWWRVGWIPVVLLPLAWYLVMLWYSGFDRPQGALRRRQRPGLIITGLLVVTFVVLFVTANPLPAFQQVAQLNLDATPAVAGMPTLMLLYPLYVVLCLGLSLDALLRPEPSPRVMGDTARRRARPWLLTTSVLLLVVSLMVAWVMVWIVSSARQLALGEVYSSLSGAIARFDLSISSLIAAAIVLLGQAIAAYEVFTGHTLPRRGLVRHWRQAVVLAASYGVVVGWTLAAHLAPIYGLLLTTLLMTLFFALLSWRSFAERERALEQLRPFAASPRLYERLLAPSPPASLDVDAGSLFRTLCADVLATRVAYLTPLGPLAALAGPRLAYPEGGQVSTAALLAVAGELESSTALCVPVAPELYGGATWAVALRGSPLGARGERLHSRDLVGVLLIGDKDDGGLYAQEEIEIARASGQRLLDTLAGVEVARRLLALQRQRLAGSRDYDELSRAVFDQRARRLLHDEVLPALHTAMLTLHAARPAPTADGDDPLALLVDAHRQISDLLREMPAGAPPEISRLGLLGALAGVVTSEMGEPFDRVTWQVDPAAEREAAGLAPLAAEVLFYAAREAMRNAARHGRDPVGKRPLALHVTATWHAPLPATHAGRLEIIIQDDGVGYNGVGYNGVGYNGAMPPAAGAHGAGSGQGLALHSTMMAVVGGTLAVESAPGAGTRVTLALPGSVAGET